MRDLLNDMEEETIRDPMKVASQSMKSQLPKRFYKQVTVEETNGNYAVLLDGRGVKTPARNPLEMSNLESAELVAGEWSAQKEHIDPAAMPATLLVNTAIDGVANEMQAVVEDVIKFAGTDLLCYRAESPQGLVDLQREHWDPVLDWCASDLSARFDLTEGVVHIEQPKEAITAFGVHVNAVNDPIVLAALHTVTSLTGSALLAMAVLREGCSADQAWQGAHVDEDWQISLWGEDHEAIARREKRKADFDAASAMMKALT